MSFSLSRWREFGLGLAVGLSLSLFVLVWQNYREKEAAKTAAEVPRPEPRAAKDPGAGDVEDTARNYDFYDRLPNFEVVMFSLSKAEAIYDELAAAHRLLLPERLLT